MPSNGQITVPPGFRFHPTDEELVYYYLRKKVSYETIDIDVIREIDLNKLEPWDLKEKCRIGSAPQNEWYFFSHKDKKYPTGTRTNRATTAGFWKATGRDKVIHLTTNSQRIGMRKTLVFYTGRAPHGQKTDWIMHEYRVDDYTTDVQEDGWVVCRMFKKKNQNIRGNFQAEVNSQEEHDQCYSTNNNMKSIIVSGSSPLQTHMQTLYNHDHNNYHAFDHANSMHLPHLFSPDSTHHFSLAPSFNDENNNNNNIPLNTMDPEGSHNLLRPATTSGTTSTTSRLVQQQVHERLHGDWSFLDKLLASHHSNPNNSQQVGDDHVGASSSTHKVPFQYLGCSHENDGFK